MRHFTLTGVPPIGKGRPRMTRSGHAYTPQKTRDYENAVKAAYLEAVKDAPYEKGVPLKMTVWCGYPIPKSDSMKKRVEKFRGFTKPTVKPDLSNVVKSVEDALNEVCYADDAQITTLVIRKVYALLPGIEVWIDTDTDE